MPIPIEDDLANVLTIVQRIFTGPRDVRDQIDRVLARYTDEQLIDFEQLTADRAIVAGMVRADVDQWGVTVATRERCAALALAIDPALGF